MSKRQEQDHMPSRFSLPRWWEAGIMIVLFAFLVHAVKTIELTELTWEEVREIPLNIWHTLGDMVPPDFGRIGPFLRTLHETFQMAVVGTSVGAVMSLPLALLSTRQLSPHPTIYYAARSLAALMRTIPPLVWGIVFIPAVGLGPRAGTMALFVMTLGFCTRFYAEAMEEVDEEPQEALAAMGTGRPGIIFCAVIPAALPPFFNAATFSLEQAVRSSVILGIVGAGGIGNELEVSMTQHRFDEAAAIIILIFGLVLGVERASSFLRSRIK
jgi:phosphonate transport system permease protein